MFSIAPCSFFLSPMIPASLFAFFNTCSFSCLGFLAPAILRGGPFLFVYLGGSSLLAFNVMFRIFFFLEGAFGDLLFAS